MSDCQSFFQRATPLLLEVSDVTSSRRNSPLALFRLIQGQAEDAVESESVGGAAGVD